MSSYLKFMWNYKHIIIPLFLWIGIVLDYAHINFIIHKIGSNNSDYNGFSYSVEVSFTQIWNLITTNINNMIKGI